jgi:hypothetical protein
MLKPKVLPQQEAKGSTRFSLDLRLEQHCQFFMLDSLLKQFFIKEINKTKEVCHQCPIINFTKKVSLEKINSVDQ